MFSCTHCTLFTVHHTLLKVALALYPSHCTLYTVHCTVKWISETEIELSKTLLLYLKLSNFPKVYTWMKTLLECGFSSQTKHSVPLTKHLTAAPSQKLGPPSGDKFPTLGHKITVIVKLICRLHKIFLGARCRITISS